MPRFDFDIRLIERRPFDEYRRGWAPDGYVTGGVYIGVMVSSDSGKRFQGCRAYDDITDGLSKLYLFNRLDGGSLHDHAPVLWREILPPGTQEPISVEERPDEEILSTGSSRFSSRPGGWTWTDFHDRWDLSVSRVGRAYRIDVPRQFDFASSQIHVVEHGVVSGTVDGEPVNGVSFLMHTFAEKGSDCKFIHLPLMNGMNNGWLFWMVEYEDGDIALGEARIGQPGTGWEMSYLYRNGEDMLTTTPIISYRHSPSGPVDRCHVEVEGFSLSCDLDVCAVWPHLTFGEVVSTSDPRSIRRSWANVEWNPSNYREVLAGLMAGKITKEQMRASTIVDGRLDIPGFGHAPTG